MACFPAKFYEISILLYGGVYVLCMPPLTRTVQIIKKTVEKKVKLGAQLAASTPGAAALLNKRVGWLVMMTVKNYRCFTTLSDAGCG